MVGEVEWRGWRGVLEGWSGGGGGGRGVGSAYSKKAWRPGPEANGGSTGCWTFFNPHIQHSHRTPTKSGQPTRSDSLLSRCFLDLLRPKMRPSEPALPEFLLNEGWWAKSVAAGGNQLQGGCCFCVLLPCPWSKKIRRRRFANFDASNWLESFTDGLALGFSQLPGTCRKVPLNGRLLRRLCPSPIAAARQSGSPSRATDP